MQRQIVVVLLVGTFQKIERFFVGLIRRPVLVDVNAGLARAGDVNALLVPLCVAVVAVATAVVGTHHIQECGQAVIR